MGGAISVNSSNISSIYSNVNSSNISSCNSSNISLISSTISFAITVLSYVIVNLAPNKLGPPKSTGVESPSIPVQVQSN